MVPQRRISEEGENPQGEPLRYDWMNDRGVASYTSQWMNIQFIMAS